MPEAMIAKGKAELDATYKKTGPGLSVEERARIIADLDTECLARGSPYSRAAAK